LRGVRAVIESTGRYRIVGEARNGREALELSQRLQPDIAVLDYSLPELNGLDLTRAIRSECPGTEVLIYSAHEEAEIVLNALRAGARGFVVKADTEQHLLAGLEALSIGRPYFSSVVSDALVDQFVLEEPRPRSILTPREREIVQLIAEGWTNRQVAQQMGVTVKTIETHRGSAMRKIKARSTATLVLWAIRNNLVQP